MCGVTTGGKEECDWDCNVELGTLVLQEQQIINPECLEDCFEKTHCVRRLLEDPECSQKTVNALIEPSCIQSIVRKQIHFYTGELKKQYRKLNMLP